MGLLEKLAGLKAPYPGVRWQPSTGKVLAATEAFKALHIGAQEAALALPSWDFLRVDGEVYAKHITESAADEEVFFLLPAQGYNEAVDKIKSLEKENAFLRDQLHVFVQQLPVPVFVLEEKSSSRVTFANQLLLDLIGVPLSRLYKGLSLEDIFPDHVEQAQAILSQARQTQKPQQEIVEGFRSEGSPYAYLVRAFPFETPSLRGFFFALVDVSKEREQERRLEMQNQELVTLAEELRQNQEELQITLKEVEAARKEAEARRKDLEDSLLAAQRYQRTILLRTRELISLWGRDHTAVVARAHSYVGGDFLFAMRQGDYIYVVVGDATGHGPSGALLALTVRSQLLYAFSSLAHPESLPQVLEEARDMLFEVLDVDLNKVLSIDGAEVGILALPTKRSGYFYFAGAGMNLYALSPNGTLHKYKGARHGLGWNFPGRALEAFSVEKVPYIANTTLFLFTDGLPDQHDANYSKLGLRTVEKWLIESATSGSEPADKVRYISQCWQYFQQDAPQTDDMLLVAARL
jgi:serine phosphatase RsbU (regulator of sigma subunit)/PAS domain-containing protein